MKKKTCFITFILCLLKKLTFNYTHSWNSPFIRVYKDGGLSFQIFHNRGEGFKIGDNLKKGAGNIGGSS